MNERAKLKARYSDAEKLLKTTEENIRLRSARRLAELLKLPELGRMEHLDDTNLTPVDRRRLRNSIAANLRRGTVKFAVAGAQFGGRRGLRWIRRNWLGAILSGIILIPSGTFLAMAWENTGEAGVVTVPLTLNWLFPTGEVVQTISKPGDPLVIMSRSDQTIVVRKWFPGHGYAIANIRR